MYFHALCVCVHAYTVCVRENVRVRDLCVFVWYVCALIAKSNSKLPHMSILGQWICVRLLCRAIEMSLTSSAHASM